MNINKVDYEKLAAIHSTEEDSTTIRGRVAVARATQAERFQKSDAKEKYFNSEMDAGDIEKFAFLADNAQKILRLIRGEASKFSGRAFHRVIKVARTIADLAGFKDHIKKACLEALQYRQKM